MQKFFSFLTAIFTCCGSLLYAAKDPCKPDFTDTDNISKKLIMQWEAVLDASGFMKSIWSGEDITFKAIIRRGGDKNLIMINVKKRESNLTRAAFESQYHASNGAKITFGFKGAEPTSFTVTQAQNEAKALAMTGDLIMVAVWAAEVSDADILAMREKLTTKQIDAMQISTSNGVINKNIKNEVGLILMEKFKCYYSELDVRGLKLPTTPNQSASSPEGTKLDSSKNADTPQITIDQIIQMTAAKVSDDIIVLSIRNSGSKFVLTPDILIKLKSAGVSDKVIQAMVQ